MTDTAKIPGGFDSEAELEALAEHLTDPDTVLPRPVFSRTTRPEEQPGRAFMIEQFGSQEALDAVLRKAGRPKLGQTPQGLSPTVRGRVPVRDRELFDQLRAETGKSESELVREAVKLLLVRYADGKAA